MAGPSLGPAGPVPEPTPVHSPQGTMGTQDRARRTIRGVAVADFIFAAFAIFDLLAALLGVSTSFILPAPLARVSFIAALGAAAFAGLFIAGGLGLVREQRWGWMITVVALVLTAASRLLSVAATPLRSILVVVAAAIVFALLDARDVRAFFGFRGRSHPADSVPRS
ncbi:MAG: hypothetical protein ACYDDF_00980 [Thermoplasmatota archaeon]